MILRFKESIFESRNETILNLKKLRTCLESIILNRHAGHSSLAHGPEGLTFDSETQTRGSQARRSRRYALRQMPDGTWGFGLPE